MTLVQEPVSLAINFWVFVIWMQILYNNVWSLLLLPEIILEDFTASFWSLLELNDLLESAKTQQL